LSKALDKTNKWHIKLSTRTLNPKLGIRYLIFPIGFLNVQPTYVYPSTGIYIPASSDSITIPPPIPSPCRPYHSCVAMQLPHGNRRHYPSHPPQLWRASGLVVRTRLSRVRHDPLTALCAIVPTRQAPRRDALERIESDKIVQ
jgi:hypothetical protein